MKKYSCLVLLVAPLFSMAQTPLLTLQEAIAAAMKNNFEVVIAKNEASISSINNNWGAALPVVSAGLNKTLASNNIQQELANGTTIKRDGASVNNFNAGLAVSWRIFDGMGMFATKKRLEELEKIGELGFRRMVNQKAYEAIAAYYDIVRLKQQAIATKEVISLYQERLKIAETRFNVGSSAKPDLLQAQVDLNEQKSLLLTIENNIVIGKTLLNNILARNPATEFETADSFSHARPVDIASIQQKVNAQNPDVLLAQGNLAVLMQTKKEINALRLPSATIGGNYNFVRNKSAAGFNLLNQTYGPSGTFGLQVPIFNGGLIKRQVQVAAINIQNQQIALEQLHNQLNSSLTNSYLNYTNGIKLVEMEKQNLVIVKENNYINIERFKKSSITSVELRQGQVNFSNAQTRLIDALYQVKVSEAEMMLLAGEIMSE
jgi:outer membrane protein